MPDDTIDTTDTDEKDDDVPPFDHTEDDALAGTAAGEAIMAGRDMLLAAESGCPIHLCHISAKLSHNSANGVGCTAGA